MDKPDVQGQNESASDVGSSALLEAQPEPAPTTLAVVGVDLSKTRELEVRVKYDKVIAKRFHVDIEITESGGRKGGRRTTIVNKSFAVVANSFEEVYKVIPGLITAATVHARA